MAGYLRSARSESGSEAEPHGGYFACPHRQSPLCEICSGDGRVRQCWRMCVETDLALSASDPRYDGPAIQELLEAVTVQAAEQNCHFNVLRFVEISEAGGEVL